MALFPDWIAPRQGHDWTDADVIRAVSWFKSFVPADQMAERLSACEAFLLDARTQWLEGLPAPTYRRADAAAWHMFQGATFADGRRYAIPDDFVLIVPYLKRIGIELDTLTEIPGAEERAERLMTRERSQPEPGIFELLVALAWRRHGWTVEFVPETRANRTPDLRVQKGNRRWSVECKRLMPAQYARVERDRAMTLAVPVHRLSEQRGQSFGMQVIYKVELGNIPPDYLHTRLSQFEDLTNADWSDEIADVVTFRPAWELIRRVMGHDDVFYGSSRMIELFVGNYQHQADHSFSGRWIPSPTHLFHAHTLLHGSCVTWISASAEADRQKARHFRQIIARAETQLDQDRPGVVHVGVETIGAHRIDAFRHLRNLVEARLFVPTNPRLRWVYGNYFSPELTTDPNETWALNETMAPYKIGRHTTVWPLPDHLLVSDEEAANAGVHW